MKTKSSLKYHGGKSYLARPITALMPPHIHYCEEYFGGGSVLLESGFEFPNRSEVVNDIDHQLCEFWWCLQGKGKKGEREDFLEQCRLTPFSRPDYETAAELLEVIQKKGGKQGTTLADRAWAFFVTNRQSLAGRMEGWAPLSKLRTRRLMNEQASAWIGAVDLLPDMILRMSAVVVENDKAVAVFKREDSPKTLHYLDPPYHPDTVSSPEVYRFPMTVKDHEELLAVITDGGVKGKVMLSGYDNPLYKKALKGWTRKAFKIDNKAAGGGLKDVRTECLWMNY